MNKLADISVFEGLQTVQNAKFGLSNLSVFNDYSEQEKQQRIEWCENAIQELQQEVKNVQHTVLQARNRYNFSFGQWNDYQDFQQEVQTKIDAFENRIKQIKNKDPEGQFTIPCFEIEQKLNEFKSQLKLDVDTPTHVKPMLPGGLSNSLSIFTAFQ